MKIIKYFFVGGIAAIVDIGLFYLGAGVARWNYMIVGTVSFTLATLVNYFISVRVVFQSGTRFSRRNELLLVFLVSCAGLAINQAILYVCVSRAAIGLMPAKLRYWDLYREKRDEMLKDPEASFRRLFGEEFARAYEEQLRQLKAEDGSAGRASPRAPRPPDT